MSSLFSTFNNKLPVLSIEQFSFECQFFMHLSFSRVLRQLQVIAVNAVNQWLHTQMRQNVQFSIVLTLSPPLYAFKNKTIFDHRLHNSYFLEF